MAVDRGFHVAVGYLLQGGCNVNALNSQEQSALHRAAYKGDTTIIDLLLATGVYTDMQTSKVLNHETNIYKNFHNV